VTVTGLTLLALGWCRRGWGSRSIALGMSWVVVYTLHVVAKVPVAGEAISLDTSLAAFIAAQERLVSMSVHSMGLTLVAEQAGRG